MFSVQSSPGAAGRRRLALRLRSLPEGCPPQSNFFMLLININDFFMKIRYYSGYYFGSHWCIFHKNFNVNHENVKTLISFRKISKKSSKIIIKKKFTKKLKKKLKKNDKKIYIFFKFVHTRPTRCDVSIERVNGHL